MPAILTSGISLFEVLVSLFILSCVLLGLNAVMISAFHSQVNAYYFSTAEQQLINMEERLRWLLGDDGLTTQVQLWNQENRELLPQGRGTVMGNYPHYQLTIYWGGSQPYCENSYQGHAGCISEKFTI